ncbi:hypothetical protein B0H11DRAFT_2213365 [Mycena galericulata]|nr:hypothetical protein B0H11DRAFT_2213365 [Mycena galericulata]
MDVIMGDRQRTTSESASGDVDTPLRLTLNEFPMDTLIHIQSFMDPTDILSLRQASKLMASATKHRIVWLDALRRVCALHEVSMLTYPIENMSPAELEHAATSPERFLAQVSKTTDVLIPALSTRLLQPRLPKSSIGPPGPLGEVSLMRLIPGGRYLVISNDAARISVWDLGYGPAAIIDPHPFASIVLGHSPKEIFIQPTKDHHGFRLLVYYTDGNALVEIMVFEVYPAAEKPTFTCIAKRRIFSPKLGAVTLIPDKFVCYHDFLVTIWDFVEDSSAVVHVYQPLLSITASPTTIFGQHDEGISVIEIPPLHPTGTPAAEAVVETATPLMMLSHVHAVFEHSADIYASQGDWHSSPDVPVVLDVFGLLLDGSNAYARCLIKPVSGGDDLPRALPVLNGISRVPPDTFDANFYGRLRFAGTHLVRTWPTDNQIMINAAEIPAGRQIEFESKTGWLWELPEGGEVWVYDLDAMSGRLVALASPFEIRVMDYLLPNV